MGSTAVVATDRPTAWEYFVNVIGGQKPIATVRTDHGERAARAERRRAAGRHRGRP